MIIVVDRLIRLLFLNGLLILFFPKLVCGKVSTLVYFEFGKSETFFFILPVFTKEKLVLYWFCKIALMVKRKLQFCQKIKFFNREIEFESNKSSLSITQKRPQAYSESCQTSKMGHFVKLVNGFRLSTIFAK